MWMSVAACSVFRHAVNVDYNAYNIIEHKPSRAAGSTLGWRYGPGVAYNLTLTHLHKARLSAGVKYTWFNSTSRRIEIKGTNEDPTNPNDLWVKANFHFLQPQLNLALTLGKYDNVFLDASTSFSYNVLFAGQFTPRHIDPDGSIGSKYFPSADFNTSHGRLRGQGWKLGLGLTGGYALST
jgi:hypothetical protein